MSPLARVLRRRAVGLLGAMTAVVATWTVAAPAAQAEDMRGRQWYLDAMRADELWKVATGKGVTVAVLDSGVDSTVSELRGKVLPGYNFYDAAEGPGRIDNRDDDRHGTNMAIAIAGSGVNGGVKGIAPDAKILPVRTGDFAFFGNGATLKGIRYAADNGARVINISQGGPADEAEDREWLAAVEYAQKKGALIFAASGNEGLDLRAYPAAIPGVVAVGALDTKGKVAKFSNYGSHLALAAPGVELPGRCTNDKTKYCSFQGTSGASAIASGTAALIWSAHPDWTANQVLRVMMETAGHVGEVPSKYIGYGSIRPAQILLEGKGDPGDPNVNPLLAAQRSQSPTPQTSPSPDSTGASGTNGPTQEPKQPESAARPDEGGFPLWGIAVSAVAVVAVIGVVVVAAGRRNRRA
ncbi:S8 family serine peptidase [Streptomyces sp. P9(2023)]|uniref:S8 family peptidase n=1 Tax=Streptomyces sp. P9(2023) TaxID=3064394 RepID=UPI0028F40B50|nr:S8 family serine peptidase [Streptomyces sp. P9(2023)]MDT9693419.1 S8 family serine peptidase [Streptomyces sp. P9(2023)]